MKAEWRQGSDFAEVAEALNVNTDQVLAVVNPGQKGVAVVFFTPDETMTVWSAILERDEHQIMTASRIEERPGLKEKILLGDDQLEAFMKSAKEQRPDE
jgi:hypothetical protein